MGRRRVATGEGVCAKTEGRAQCVIGSDSAGWAAGSERECGLPDGREGTGSGGAERSRCVGWEAEADNER